MRIEGMFLSAKIVNSRCHEGLNTYVQTLFQKIHGYSAIGIGDNNSRVSHAYSVDNNKNRLPRPCSVQAKTSGTAQKIVYHTQISLHARFRAARHAHA